LEGKFRTTATIMHFAQCGLFYCRTLYFNLTDKTSDLKTSRPSFWSVSIVNNSLNVYISVPNQRYRTIDFEGTFRDASMKKFYYKSSKVQKVFKDWKTSEHSTV